jgi:uncharacterized protein (TIGR00290 family)
MRAFCSWSGGKDCALALWRARAAGHQVVSLLNFVDEEGRRSRSHGIASELIRAQAAAAGIPLLQRATSWGAYEQNFKDAVLELKAQGVEAGIFGDIDIVEHREWVESTCAALGIVALLPLWQEKPYSLLQEFLNLGFRAVIVSTRLERAWLGRELSQELAREVEARGSHPLGENGEYHTFVIAGPFFRHQLRISHRQVWQKDGHWFLDLALSRE